MFKKITLIAAIACYSHNAFANTTSMDTLLALAGEWESVPEKGGEKNAIRYEIASEGKTLVETFFGMVTLYHAHNDVVMATHYCSEGNQPRFTAPANLGSDRKLTFSFLDITNAGAHPHHISGIEFHFVNPNRFVQTWKWKDEGGESQFSNTFVRKGSIMGYVIEKKSEAGFTALVASERATTPQECGEKIPALLKTVGDALSSQALSPVGAPFTQFTKFEQGAIEFSAGFPVAAEALPVNGTATIKIVAGEVLETIHYGSQEGIGQAYAALHAYMEANGLKAAGAPWESYVDDPSQVSEELVRTVVRYPVQ